MGNLCGLFSEHCGNTLQQEPWDTFVITGDIHAMWLRDSTAQVLHDLRFAEDEAIAEMIEGLIARQTRCILLDPYANAFNREASAYKPYADTPRASDWVWERKYETDSLCYPLSLADQYLSVTGRNGFLTESFHQILKTVVAVLRQEQDHASSPYRFERANCPPSDTLPNGGAGTPVGYTGMTWSGFRPSDDACRYGYLVPSNLFAVRALAVTERLADLLGDAALTGESRSLQEEIAAGIEQYGVVQHPVFGEIYAYEVDGLGGVHHMDDANVPSLLSLPYLQVCEPDDARYLRTRQFVLSEENPCFFRDAMAAGVGSPHTPDGYVWPIGLCVQAITSTDTEEQAAILGTLMCTHAGTERMHESFEPDAPERYTRGWFVWANSMFAELMLRLWEQGTLDAVLKQMPTNY